MFLSYFHFSVFSFYFLENFFDFIFLSMSEMFCFNHVFHFKELFLILQFPPFFNSLFFCHRSNTSLIPLKIITVSLRF